MNFMPLGKLGVHVTGDQAHFGCFWPGVRLQEGYRVEVRIIHEQDQFIQGRPPFAQQLNPVPDAIYGEYWETVVRLAPPGPSRHWGLPGKYVYRYAILGPGGQEIDWIIDPFGREFGVGRHAAFTFGYTPYVWSQTEAQWRTPRHHDLVLYEMNLMEFAGSLELAAERLDYLQDLGVTGISLMPVTNITDAIDWGYTPIGYFGVDERFGNRASFQNFVDQAHQRGLAVLVDAIYGHTSSLFAYEYAYSRLGLANPMMGAFAADDFGPGVDWTRAFAQDFFYSVNRHWLEVFHVDGFRYDCVPNYWELGPAFRGYASIAYHTYQHVKARVAAGDPHYLRFEDHPNPLRLIQCAEQLQAPNAVLEQTYSTCTWQNETLSAAEAVAHGDRDALTRLGRALGALGLPTERTVNQDRLFKSPLQFIENHDHSRFVGHFGVVNPDSQGNPLFEQGDRSQWFKLQPYLIGLLLAKGIPLLWQGQELVENAQVPPGGPGRTGFLRLVHWEYFYDNAGRSLLTLVRRLLKLRASLAQTRSGEHFFFSDPERYEQRGLVLFARYFPGTSEYTLVALNFTDSACWAPFWFPLAGNYREELHGAADARLHLSGVVAFQERWLEIPAHYGRVWTHY